MQDLVYVSITGLIIRHVWHIPVFWRHAAASMKQAKLTEGCLDADAKTINGVHHTRSVWVDHSKMRDFLADGAHLKAIQAFPKIAFGKTFGFETTTIPDWPEVHRLWHQDGREV